MNSPGTEVTINCVKSYGLAKLIHVGLHRGHEVDRPVEDSLKFSCQQPRRDRGQRDG